MTVIVVCLMLQKDTKGQVLFDQVCRQLNLIERHCFGLRFVDANQQRVSTVASVVYIVFSLTFHNLDRNSLHTATGLYTGHSVLNRHLHIMGLQSSPFCEHCEGEPETTIQYLP